MPDVYVSARQVDRSILILEEKDVIRYSCIYISRFRIDVYIYIYDGQPIFIKISSNEKNRTKENAIYSAREA